jgi:DNA-binding transcriptional ArsR family regulator
MPTRRCSFEALLTLGTKYCSLKLGKHALSYQHANELGMKTANAASALRALGDDTRRQIFDRLAVRPLAVTEIARGLKVSRPAVSQHLKVLKEAGLVNDHAEGRSRIYQIDPNGLAAVRAWLDQHWARAFVAFADYVEREDKLKE